MNSSLRRQFAKTVQFVIYMPHFISTVVMVGIILEFLNPRVGIVNLLLQGIGFEARDYLAVPELFKGIYVWSGIWQNAGWAPLFIWRRCRRSTRSCTRRRLSMAPAACSVRG